MMDYEKIAALITIVSAGGTLVVQSAVHYKKIATLQKQINILHDKEEQISTTNIVRDLEELKAKLSTLLNQEDRPYFILDKYGSVKWVNEEFCNITQRIKEDLLGYGWTLSIDPIDRNRLSKAIEAAVEDKTDLHITFGLLKEHKNIIQVKCTISPFEYHGECDFLCVLKEISQ